MASVTVNQAFRLLLYFITGRERARFMFVFFLAIIMALIELSIAGLVALMATAFSSPEAVMQLKQVLWLRKTVGLQFLQDPRLLVLSLLGGVLCSVILKNLLSVAQQWHISALSVGTANRVQQHILNFFLRSPFLWVMARGTPNLIFRLGVSNQFLALIGSALQVFSNILMMITMLGGLLAVSFMPSLLFFVCLGVGGTLIVIWARGVLDRLAQAQHKVDYDLNFLRQTSVNAIKEMRMYGRESHLNAAFAGLLDISLTVQRKWQSFSRVPVSLLEIWGFSTLCAVLVFLVFIQQASMGLVTGIMGFLAAAAWRCLPVANRLMDQLAILRGALPYIQTVAETLQTEKELASQLSPAFDEELESVTFQREVRFDKVSFQYPESSRPALDSVSMHIKTGEITGVVGLSGAGKSTLVNLLTGLFVPSSGEITVDDKSLSRNTVPTWMRKIGYVAQSPFLLDASLAENIAFSRWGESIDRERVSECCQMAALDFLDQLEDGIDTIIGERGMRLSGGQAQRVAIARALYSEPELIIFDEATSSLDIKNEKAIHDTIMSLRRKATMVIIAHRLSTVEGCDSVIWLDNGAIVEKGASSEVLEHYKNALNKSGESDEVL